jgi:hypothetical protein
MRNALKTSEFLKEVELLFAEQASSTQTICILGDFNLHWEKQMDTHVAKFKAILESLGLQQHIGVPTHRCGHTLDLVITQRDDTFLRDITVVNDHLSDHHSITCKVLEGRIPPAQRPTRTVRKLRNIDTKELSEKLSHAFSLTSQGQSPTQLVDTYDRSIESVLDKVAPKKEIHMKQGGRKDWYSDEIHQARRRHERKYRKTGLQVHREMFCDQRLKVATLIDNAKARYYKDKLGSADQSAAYKTIKSLLKPSLQKALPDAPSDQHLADAFATFFDEKVANIRATLASARGLTPTTSDTPTSATFSDFALVSEDEVSKFIRKSPTKSCSLDVLPTWLLKDSEILHILLPHITELINASLSSGCVPNRHKEAIITPLLKKEGLDVDILKNYRPVSNLSFNSKLLERVVAAQLSRHLTENNLLDPLQSAYRPGHSCENAPVKVKCDIDIALAERDGVLLLLLDLSAAFDLVDHPLLLDRLQTKHGVTGVAMEWMESYLSSRTQSVMIGNTTSVAKTLDTGVPQGSVLGPLLFLAYVRPLSDIIDAQGIPRHGYADDGQLYVRFSLKHVSSLFEARDSLQECAKHVRNWMMHNKLKVNDNKTEFMVIAPKHVHTKLQHTEVTIRVGEADITPSSTVRNLGGNFDQYMSMQPHVSSVV